MAVDTRVGITHRWLRLSLARREPVLILSREVPMKGIPEAIPVTIDNVNRDGDGELDVDRLLNPSRDLGLPVKDVGETGKHHVVAVLHVEGGGEFQPESVR